MIGLMMMLVASTDIQGFISGNKLLELCTQDDQLQCIGYVEGASDMLQTFDAFAKAKTLCMSDKVTARQEKDIVVKYLTDNPATRDQAAGGIVMIALNEAFGCAKGG